MEVQAQRGVRRGNRCSHRVSFVNGSGRGGGHVFISYVREDAQHVDRLELILEAAGVQVWRDTEALWPGQDWALDDPTRDHR